MLRTYFSTQQIVALSASESAYISIKDVVHALKICSVLVECGVTLEMTGKTVVTAGRATAARRGVCRMHHLDARLSWLQQLCAEGVMEPQFWLGDHNLAELESKMIDNEMGLTDGGSEFPRCSRGSKRLSCVNLKREERMRDEWLVPDLCGNGHRDLDGVVRGDLLGFPFQMTAVSRKRPTRMLRGDVK